MPEWSDWHLMVSEPESFKIDVHSDAASRVTAIFPHQSYSLQLCKHRSRDENRAHLAIRRSEAHIKGIASVDWPNTRGASRRRRAGKASHRLRPWATTECRRGPA